MSAEKGDRLFAMRIAITDNVSRTGSPSRISGTMGLNGVSPCVRQSDSVTAEKPRSWLPVSPMKTVAGCVLNRRNPKMEPASANATSPMTTSSPCQARYPMQAKMSRQMPPASPSSPSERLTALVTPTIASTVIGTQTHSGRTAPSGSSAPNEWIVTPP